MHISPVNVSVHTTNPELRVKMMKNKRSGEVLSYLGRLADAGISLCCQIVLCRGLNDGEELDRTMRDLEALAPAMQSTSVVPAGLTKFRDGLYQLESFSPAECADIIKQITEFGDKCLQKHGTRLFYPADELYIKAGLPLPEDSFYEDYSQIQNGVGMLTDMKTCVLVELEDTEKYAPYKSISRTVSIATGFAAAAHMRELAELLQGYFENLKINVYPIENRFFGEQITVSGLLTGKDISEQLADKPLGDALLIPAECLRAEGDVLLDDVTPDDLSRALGVPVLPSESEAEKFISGVLGIVD
jgi:putative radical SAM enzyme (TIGR03279 family)